MKTGLFGGDWEDFIQPVNDYFGNAINQIQNQGAHGEPARMQATDDALGANAGNGADNAESRDSRLLPVEKASNTGPIYR
ncbi:MAG: hypothetical protein ACXWLJ_05950 [Rhizomicrobium sp.]